MTKPKSANTSKRKPPKTAWPEGKSGNPKGAPKRGQSWAEVIKQVTEMTKDELIAWVGATSPFAATLLQLPKGLALKYVVVLAAITGTINEPNARILTWLAERSEGKLPQPIVGDADLSPIQIVLVDKTVDAK